MKSLLFSCMTLLFTLILMSETCAQQPMNLWEAVDRNDISQIEDINSEELPLNYQLVQMRDPEMIASIMQSAPKRFSSEARLNKVSLQLPLPDGSQTMFNLVNAPVLQEQLAAAYPDLQTFTAMGKDNPNLHAKIESTPQGLFAMITGAPQGTMFLQPLDVKNNIYYSFYKKDASNLELPFQCTVEDELEDMDDSPSINRSNNTDCQFRQYRLALACTGEYAQLIDDGDNSNGDIVADVLASMVVAMNRVNGIFERELGITMVIIDRNEEVIFTDPDTDLYTNIMSSLPAQNTTAMQVFLGKDAYDIGHVFSSAGGGIAFRRGPCVGRKAGGASGIRGRTGDAFASYVVAHEMAHQFGGRHTQGNDCYRSEFASYEPGSGSTILSYAGICFPSVQRQADDYFHSTSIEQMREFITDGGSECPVFLETNNEAPIVDAGADYLIPASTPFLLEGQATDPEGDPLTYSWEQVDKEFVTHPPSPRATEGPSIRTFPPTTESQRYIPRLSVLRGEENNEWEVLPEVSRDLNFRLIARGNNGIYGCTSEDDMLVSSIGSAGPFEVTQPNREETWLVGDSEVISWNVARTDQAPINCNFVDIYYSTDGGRSFPFLFVENVPNNGLYEFVVSKLSDEPIRFLVRGSDNIFFNIASSDVLIEGISSTSNEFIDDGNFIISPNPAQNEIQIDLSFNNAFEGELQLINLMGQLFRQVPFVTEQRHTEQLILQGLPSGMYIVKLVDANGRSQMKKFVKQ